MKWILFFLITATFLQAERPPKWVQIPEANEARPVGASSWILYDSMRINQENASTVTYTHRRAVMPMSEAGVQNAYCVIPFSAGAETLVSAKAWIVSPDGSKCTLYGGTDFFVVSSTISNFTWDPSKVVQFVGTPYLQEGWIFAWEIQLRSDFGAFDFRWSPPQNLPVKYASFEAIPEEGGELKWKAFSKGVPAPEAGRSSHSLRWDFSNLPGLNPRLPKNTETSIPEIGVYMFEPGSPAFKTWENVAQMARTEIDPKNVATPAIAATAKRLEGTGTLWQRIAPVCRFVQKEIVYLLVQIDTDSLAGFRPHTAAEIFQNRFGDCKDKATLLCSMLNSLGADAHVMLVSNGAPRQIWADWPSVGFNHAIVAIRETEPVPLGWTTVQSGNENYALFDPTDDRVPLGLLPPSDVNGLGLVLAPTVTAPVLIPSIPALDESHAVKITAKLREDGSCAMDIEERRSGLAAAAATEKDETVTRNQRTMDLEKNIQQHVPLISDLVWDSRSDKATHRWTRNSHFAAQFVGKRVAGGGMYLYTDLMSVVPRAETWDEGTDGWLSFPTETLRQEFHLIAPAGWNVTETPAEWSMKTASGEASIHFEKTDGEWVEKFQLQITGGSLDRPAYLELRKLLLASTAAERRPLMLRRALVPAPAVTVLPKTTPAVSYN